MTIYDKSNAANFTYIWEISNCPNLLIPGKITSPTFVVESLDNSRWHLSLFSICEEQFTFSIHRDTDAGPECILIDYELSFVSLEGTYSHEEKCTFNFKKDGFCVIEPFHILDIFGTRRQLFVVNECVTVSFRMWKVGSLECEQKLCYAVTRLAIEKRSFFWRIRNFSTFERGQELTYPINSTVNGDVLLVMILSMTNDDSETLRIKFPAAKYDKRIVFSFRICMLNRKGKTSYNRTSEVNFNSHDFFVDFLWKDRILRDSTFWLPDDVLTFRCEFEIGTGISSSRIVGYRYNPQ
ncbi:speckle-type POZ protein [Trichonephila inaurata madagascariensis]|uniref:Speckle-type POZ protein n=1 Tax=Trichonephila inaurata madagascariensis TaxID=2747483 RepID=A0A8X7CV72_9ARAC|nr:speckle-type POZ protein [Trichonephila inaurata madagascariensis]